MYSLFVRHTTCVIFASFHQGKEEKHLCLFLSSTKNSSVTAEHQTKIPLSLFLLLISARIMSASGGPALSSSPPSRLSDSISSRTRFLFSSDHSSHTGFT